jgi:hypothetical protein
MRIFVAVAVLALAHIASADTAPTEIAIAVNPPVRWHALHDGSTALAASGYVGFARHHAIRVNVARYTAYRTNPIIDVIAPDDGAGTPVGNYTDVGVAWMYFPRALWDGPTFEVGVLGRRKDTRDMDDFGYETTDVHTTTVAARGLVGWSWLWAHHVFASLAVGMSGGGEFGTRTIRPEQQPMLVATTNDVAHASFAAEAFARIGAAF